MGKITYYVATSIDGFISGKNDDISGFQNASDMIAKYQEDLKEYNAVIMGRNTYEFGYKYGLKPGMAAYPHMDHYIFSSTLKFDNPDPKVKVMPTDLEIVKELKAAENNNIYLCGGGEFAGWLLKNELIDTLKIKLNPLLIGEGVPLFGNADKQYLLDHISTEEFQHGFKIIEYNIRY